MCKTKTVQQQVIEIITAQAMSHSVVGKYLYWDDISTLLEAGPDIDEKWFWDNFKFAVSKTEEQVHSALEAWVTVQYEEAIIERVEAIHRMFENDPESK